MISGLVQNGLRWVTLAVLMPLLGCQSVPQAEVPAERFAKITLASNTASRAEIQAAPGLVELEVEMTLSNKETCSAPLSLTAEPEAELTVFAYEFDHGIAPATMRLAPERYKGPSASSILSGIPATAEVLALILLTAPIWFPIYALSKHHAEKSRETAAKWCYVWVEDARNGERIAGRIPWQ